MKRFICLVLSILMIFTFFSCSGKVEEDKVELDTQESTEEIPSFEITFSEETDESGLSVNNGVPPYRSYYFKSYNELNNALIGANDEIPRTLTHAPSDLYEATLLSFEAGRSKVYVPTSNGIPIGFEDENGSHNISFYSSGGLYKLPNMWYHCRVNGFDLRINITYPSVLNNEKVKNCQTYLDILTLLSPKAHTPETNSNMYEKEFTLADGEKVMTLINPYRYPGGCILLYLYYYKDGATFMLLGDSRLLTDEFMRSFDMVEYDAVK